MQTKQPTRDQSLKYKHLMQLYIKKKKQKNKPIKKWAEGVSVMAQWLMNPTRNHEVEGSMLASLGGVRIQHCHELWCRSQIQLRSQVAVALVQAGGYSSN